MGTSPAAALEGGWAAWRAAGYPVEGKQTAVAATATVSSEPAGVMGQAGAPVTIVEFSDFQCDYCRRHALETLPLIVNSYVETGQVRYVFRDLPLDTHVNAQAAAEAARCAGAQDAFWPMHDRLFEDQEDWAGQDTAGAAELFVTYARDLDLDVESYATCLASREFSEQVREDAAQGWLAGVEGTPSFLIDGRLLSGAVAFDRFQEAIEAALAEDE